MKTIGSLLLALASAGHGFAELPAIPAAVRQPGINGSATGAELGSPFGQSFVATSTSPIYGVALAAVDIASARDLNISLWRTDMAGASLVGSPLVSGSITAGQIASYAPPVGVVTPIYFLTSFSQPYAQSAGERLAFTIDGGADMKFYFANGSSYLNGRLLADGSRDLTFATIVPEPGVFALLILGLLAIGRTTFKPHAHAAPAENVRP